MGRFNSKSDLVNSYKKKKESYSVPIKDPILCRHCKRSATNGIRCMGICVSDSDY